MGGAHTTQLMVRYCNNNINIPTPSLPIAFFQSGGELENNEEVASVVYNLISLTDKFGPDEGTYKKVSGKNKDNFSSQTSFFCANINLRIFHHTNLFNTAYEHALLKKWHSLL